MPHAANDLLDHVETVPVVLAVAADLRKIALMDGQLERAAVTGGASIYPFCWSILLAARSRGLGGVMTTFLSRVEPQAAARLALPAHHALAATIFLGVPEHQATKLRRGDVRASPPSTASTAPPSPSEPTAARVLGHPRAG